jgi:hypothetical protein
MWCRIRESAIFDDFEGLGGFSVFQFRRIENPHSARVFSRQAGRLPVRMEVPFRCRRDAGIEREIAGKRFHPAARLVGA